MNASDWESARVESGPGEVRFRVWLIAEESWELMRGVDARQALQDGHANLHGPGEPPPEAAPADFEFAAVKMPVLRSYAKEAGLEVDQGVTKDELVALLAASDWRPEV